MHTLLPYIFLLLHFFFALLILFLCLSFVTGGPFVPSRTVSTKKMIELAHLKPGMTAYDLGSGDGRVLLAAAEKGVRAVGFEINPFLVVWSKLRALFSPNISIRWKNLWHADLRSTDVVFLYLLPWNMDKLQKFLMRQLKPGSIVVTNTFIFPNWKILRQDRNHHVYVFQAGLAKK